MSNQTVGFTFHGWDFCVLQEPPVVSGAAKGYAFASADGVGSVIREACEHMLICLRGGWHQTQNLEVKCPPKDFLAWFVYTYMGGWGVGDIIAVNWRLRRPNDT